MLESLTLFIILYSVSSRPKGYQLAWTIGGHALHSRCSADWVWQRWGLQSRRPCMVKIKYMESSIL